VSLCAIFGRSEEMLASVKAGYIGRFVMQIENLKVLLVTALRTQRFTC
jgi:hypothetical protein